MTALGSRERLRAVFLDVDGTYADRGRVPREHVEAVRAARANGHLVLLCTGRAMPALSPHLLSAGFDGVVASAGAYVQVGGRVLVDTRFSADLARRVLSILLAADVGFVLESPDALYALPSVAARLTALHGRAAARLNDLGRRDGPQALTDGLQLLPDLSFVSFAKVTCFDSPVPVGALADEIGVEVAAIPSSIPDFGDTAGELYLAGLTKADGMALAAAELGIDRADMVAVGDGFNDLEMLAYAGLGVAVEGSPAPVLSAADRTAPGPGRSGVAVLFRELGLLGPDHR